MIARVFAGLALWCWRRWPLVAALAVLATLGLGWVAANHLGLDTDEDKLLSSQLPFRKAEDRLAKAFPGNDGDLVVVVDAPSAILADTAADRLTLRLQAHPDLFRAAHRPAGTDFFKREGLLYLSTAELQSLSDRLVQSQPLLGTLARDPSLRGVLATLDMMTQGLAHGQIQAADVAPALKSFAATADTVLAGAAKPFDWTALMGASSLSSSPRALILSDPRQNFGDLMPGAAATQAVKTEAAQLGLTPANGYRVRVTGSVALTDDNFSTVAQGVEISAPLSLAAVVLILFWAVRSKRLVAIILATLVLGLAATAAFAAVTVHTLNPISVAFAVMFVGIAVDFAIQFVVRFRDLRAHHPDPNAAMAACARTIAGPLVLAAAATAVGFLSFLPTDYVGVSQLGLVAGGGMVIALIIDFTLLPALLRLARPPAAKEAVGMPLARPLDAAIARHPKAIVAAAALLALLGVALLPWLKFDFDPLALQNPKAEAVSTLRDLSNDPDTSPYSIDLLAHTPTEADSLATRLEALPQVGRVVQLASFVPDRQDDKLAILSDLNDVFAPVLDPAARLPAPNAEETAAALDQTARNLRDVGALPGVPNDLATQAAHLADLLDRTRTAGPGAIDTLNRALTGGLPDMLAQLRTLLAAKPVTLADLPPDLVESWRAPDGESKISVWPKESMGDPAALRRFVIAVQSISPAISGMPVSVVEAGHAVVGSFVQAGTTALIAIAILLWLMLRRVGDAALVVLPLLLGGLYTVIGCVIVGLPINFANVIALPLLLGIGVAFNIYFVVNWRNGVTDHLQTSTCRAVLFSALTTASAFGSLALSPHLGTASMGLLLFLSVALSVTTTFLVLPAIFHLLPKRTPA